MGGGGLGRWLGGREGWVGGRWVGGWGSRAKGSRGTLRPRLVCVVIKEFEANLAREKGNLNKDECLFRFFTNVAPHLTVLDQNVKP